MENTLKDFTINIKKSIDREYDGDYNMQPNFDNDQKMLNDNVISSIENEYDDDYEDIVIDHSDDDDVLIEPNQGNNIDTIRLIKIRSLSALSDELDNINKTGVPAIIDFKYLQERKLSEFKKVGSTLKAFKNTTNANVVLLGSTGNVIVVTPKEIRLLKQ
ncbi:MAG: hypothetical protein ACI4VJ_03940 [Methanosphaera sp.]|jgi:SepF-like predicted cell division protein (DUF552 family)|uniref:hypothetical protein n=1 Tax=Methanosphaera TaxID=2316 RepID=UPI002380B256|nr:hypothetical protein [Candidatus Methanosphaera massiliense]MDD6285391.1 hypothetical protein [Methanobacteriaceae archaeon]MDE4077445.1 hypothetical protein [Candidatus Methanosphaera massiliense]MDY2744364.1 hypothetical protein [Methanosphaera sp.]